MKSAEQISSGEGVTRREFLETIPAMIALLSACTQEKRSVERESKSPSPVRTPAETLEASEAAHWLQYEVGPMIDTLVRDMRVPAGIRERVSALFREVLAGTIEYDAYGETYQPPGTEEALAKIDFNPVTRKVRLEVFVPKFKELLLEGIDEGLNEEERRLAVGIAFAHETVHLEQQKTFGKLEDRAGKYDRELGAQEEASAWATTVLEMIRPAMQGRYKVLQRFAVLAEGFRQAGDNPRDIQWVNVFRDQIKLK